MYRIGRQKDNELFWQAGLFLSRGSCLKIYLDLLQYVWEVTKIIMSVVRWRDLKRQRGWRRGD